MSSSVSCGGVIAVPGGSGSGPTPSDSVVAETAAGQAAAAGAAATYARGDHTHGSPADPIPAHVAAGDPHPQYQQAADVDAAIDAALVDHVAAADPHTLYQLEAGKGAASGYASLDGGAKVPTAELGGAGADATKFLRGDQSWATPAGGGGEAFPVGAIFIAVVATNPNTLLGYGTWAAFAAGRMLVGLDAGQAEFDTVEETGGAKTHTLVEAEIPAHVHGELAPSSASGGGLRFAVDTNANGSVAAGLDTASAGGGGAHNNLPPYIVVYMWERTA